MKRALLRGSGNGAAFTLVEILVAISLLMLMSLMLMGILGNAQTATTQNLRHLDADQQIQLVFDRISMDLGAMPLRADLPFAASTNSVTNGGAALAFFSRIPSASGGRGLSLVSYRIATDTGSGSAAPTGNLCLQRAVKGIAWGQGSFMGMTNGVVLGMPGLPGPLLVAASDYDVLGSGVIRFAVSWETKGTGAALAIPPAAGANLDLTGISALVITAVVLDGNSLKLVKPAQVAAIAGKFQDPSDPMNGVFPGSAWTALAHGTNNFPGIPPMAVQSLRVYQRVFPIESYTSF